MTKKDNIWWRKTINTVSRPNFVHLALFINNRDTEISISKFIDEEYFRCYFMSEYFNTSEEDLSLLKYSLMQKYYKNKHG